MVCINCTNSKTSVINSRTHKNAPQVWRRRRCAQCHCTFTTYERASMHDEFKVIDHKGATSPFDPGRLIRDITACFGHNPKQASHAYWLERTIEDKLLTLKILNLSTQEITSVTHEVLSTFDKLAGDQYAARHKLLS